MTKKLLFPVVIVAGVASGWMYCKYSGWVTGTCAITSNHYASTLYGAIIGFIIAGHVVHQANKASSFTHLKADRNE